MSLEAERHDVFLCFPYDAQGLGDIVLMDLEAFGLRVFRPWVAGETPGEALPDPRDVLAASTAVVGVVVSGGAVDPTLLVAIGAAQSLRKPVFIVTDNVDRPDLPPYLAAMKVYPLSRLYQMCEAITQLPRTGGRPGLRRAGSMAGRKNGKH